MCFQKKEDKMKIVLIGYSGAGKSTLAKKLADHYAVPLLHLDTLQFQPGWVDSDRQRMREQVETFLQTNEGWVIDGNYSWCCYEELLQQADQILFLSFNRWNCLYRVSKRYLKYRNKVRDSMAAGCPEKFDWEFIRWILWDGRKKRARDRYRWISRTYPEKYTILRNQKMLDSFLQQN